MKKEQKISLTESMKKLEEINLWFQNENIDLDQALEKLQVAQELTKQVKSRLTEVENQFVALKENFQED